MVHPTKTVLVIDRKMVEFLTIAKALLRDRNTHVEFVLIDIPWDIDEQTKKEILEAFSSRKIDAVLLGNNLGIGKILGQLIPPHLKQKTVVLHNQSTPFGISDQDDYKSLGIEHFSFRSHMSDTLHDLLVTNT